MRGLPDRPQLCISIRVSMSVSQTPRSLQALSVDRSRSGSGIGSSRSYFVSPPFFQALYCHRKSRSLYRSICSRNARFSVVSRCTRWPSTRLSPPSISPLRSSALRMSNAILIRSCRASVCLLGSIDKRLKTRLISVLQVSRVPPGQPFSMSTIASTCRVDKCFAIDVPPDDRLDRVRHPRGADLR